MKSASDIKERLRDLHEERLFILVQSRQRGGDLFPDEREMLKAIGIAEDHLSWVVSREYP